MLIIFFYLFITEQPGYVTIATVKQSNNFNHEKVAKSNYR